MSKEIDNLEKFVKSNNFGIGPLVLSDGTTIIDRNKFANSHLQMLKSGSGKKVLLPYFERLKQFYITIKKQTNR